MRPKPRHEPRNAPKFTVSRVGTAIADAKNVPTKLRPILVRIVEQLAREGCRAADYALSGDPPWPHLCAVHFEGWRVIIAFPTAEEVAILKIAPHNPANDPYREIAEELGVPVSTAPRTKPPCCDPAGNPPVDPTILDQLDAAFGRLTRGEQRERTRR